MIALLALTQRAAGVRGRAVPNAAQPVPTVIIPATVSLPPGAGVTFAPANSPSIFIRLRVGNASQQTALVTFDGTLHVRVPRGYAAQVTQVGGRLFPSDGLQGCEPEGAAQNIIDCRVNITPSGAAVQIITTVATTDAYPAGWNLISGTDGARLVGAVGEIYTWQPGDTEYERFLADAPLRACWGYWAYFPGGGKIALPDAPLIGCTVTPAPGEWIMVGNPSADYEAQPFNADEALLYSAIRGYYPATTTIPVGQGGWVINNGPAAANGIRIQPIPSHIPSR